jgi:hypothetical protein
MRLVIIIAALVVCVGLSFAAGVYLQPTILHRGDNSAFASMTVPAVANVASTLPSAGGSVAGSTAHGASDLGSILEEKNPYLMYKELTAYADCVPASGLGKAIEQLDALPGTDNRHQARIILAGRWAQVDPQGAMETVQKDAPGHGRYVDPERLRRAGRPRCHAGVRDGAANAGGLEAGPRD